MIRIPQIVAIAAAEQNQPRGFRLVAYTGGPLRLSGYDTDVVIDISTIDLTQQQIPALYDHVADEEYVVGQVESLAIVDGAVIASGIFTPSSDDDYASKVLARADAGYQWQVSVGADARKFERVRDGERVVVNDREYVGPIIIARGVVIREVSFVVLGADRNTSAIIARDAMMTFAEWLASLGVEDEATLPQPLLDMLKELYDEEMQQQQENTGEESPVEEEAAPAATTAAAAKVSIVARMRANVAKELARISKVCKLTSGNEELAAKAIAEGWDETKTELEMLRASRITSNKYIVANNWRSSVNDIRCHEAAVLMAGGYSRQKLEREYDDKTLQAAYDLYHGRIGLQQLLRNLAIRGGYVGDPEVRANIRPMLQAAFSTSEISGILSNVANKFLLDGYTHVDQSWRQIAAIRNVPDLKATTSYRLLAGAKFEKVGPTGEIKHGNISEQGYDNKADTYGLMLAITRQDIINDDLGALSSVPAQIGRGAGLKLNEVFWKEFLAEHTTGRTLFPTDKSKNNFIDGATDSAVSVAGLSKAVETFRNQRDAAGDLLGLTPRIWLVPVKYETLAMQIMTATEVREKGSSDKAYVTANPFVNRFTVVSTPYLSDSRMGGAYSTEFWYLLADPAELPFIEVAFLNGIEQPTVEQADADFNVLGIQMRGYFDLGVRTQDYRAAVKAKNAA